MAEKFWLYLSVVSMIQELALEDIGNVNHLIGSFPKDWKQTLKVTTSQIAANTFVPFLLAPTLEGLGVLHFWVHGQHTSWSHQDIFVPSLETGLTRQTWSVKNKNNQSRHLPDFPLKTNQFFLRLRTVFNFGDGNCGVGEIQARGKSRGDGAPLAPRHNTIAEIRDYSQCSSRPSKKNHFQWLWNSI